MEDDHIDHPIVCTVDETKSDGTYPCIMGLVLSAVMLSRA